MYPDQQLALPKEPLEKRVIVPDSHLPIICDQMPLANTPLLSWWTTEGPESILWRRDRFAGPKCILQPPPHPRPTMQLCEIACLCSKAGSCKSVAKTDIFHLLKSLGTTAQKISIPPSVLPKERRRKNALAGLLAEICCSQTQSSALL